MVYRSTLFGILFSLLFIALGPVAVLAEDEQLTHVVQPGENLSQIAQRYGVDLEELVQANEIANRNRIDRGQELIIPGLTVPDESEEVYNPLVAGTPSIHVIQRGETLGEIARQYDLTVEQLLQANNIANPNRIYFGQELKVWTAEPANAGETAQAASQQSTTYVVQDGEHLAEIARRFGVNWTVLAQVNGLNNPNHIYSGQVLTIPALNSDGGVVDMGILSPPPGGPQPTITVGKQIVVDLSDQRIYAFQDGVMVRNVLVSTGLPDTPTVQGDFRVYGRIPSQRMTGPGYDLPNVQYVQYFYQGYAIHGTYWHNNFGSPMSHGCVNLPNGEAAWFWDWAEYGTPVHVQA